MCFPLSNLDYERGVQFLEFLLPQKYSHLILPHILYLICLCCFFSLYHFHLFYFILDYNFCIDISCISFILIETYIMANRPYIYVLTKEGIIGAFFQLSIQCSQLAISLCQQEIFL